MSDDGLDANRGTGQTDMDYEPPAVFDFGPIFKVTHGNANGSGDGNAQKSD